MRIGIDSRLWGESGVGRYIRNLVKNLQEIDQRNDYVLFVIKKDYEAVRSEIRNSRFVIRIADIRWHTVREQFEFPKILEKENLDLVHFPYFSVPINYKGKFVVTIHDLILHYHSTGKASTLPLPLYRLKMAGYKYVIAQAAKRAEKIITVSNTTKEEIVKLLRVDPNKVEVTYEGVDEAIKGDVIRQPNQSKKSSLHNPRFWLSQNDGSPFPFSLSPSPFVLYVGNAYPHKNLEMLVDVFARIMSHESRIRLILVGKEDYFYRRLKEKVNKMNLENSVIFLGHVSDEELSSLYYHAKVLIVPSLMEGFGLPGLEAMARDCLVTASDIPVLREIYQDAAIYFNPKLTDELARVILEVVKHDKKDYNLYIQKGRARVRDFSWKKMAQETLRIYERCPSIRQLAEAGSG